MAIRCYIWKELSADPGFEPCYQQGLLEGWEGRAPIVYTEQVTYLCFSSHTADFVVFFFF